MSDRALEDRITERVLMQRALDAAAARIRKNSPHTRAAVRATCLRAIDAITAEVVADARASGMAIPPPEKDMMVGVRVPGVRAPIHIRRDGQLQLVGEHWPLIFNMYIARKGWDAERMCHFALLFDYAGCVEGVPPRPPLCAGCGPLRFGVHACACGCGRRYCAESCRLAHALGHRTLSTTAFEDQLD